MSIIISRTAIELTNKGRTLEGIALEWDSPATVSDDGRTQYLEEFDRACADASITQRPTRPLGVMHPWSLNQGLVSPVPVGAVVFSRGSEGLMFSAKLSNSAGGNDALELWNDGALGDVSISAKSIRQATRPSPRGTVVRRIEIGLRELSLVPPGMAGRPESRVLVQRAEQLVEGTPRKDHAERRLRALLL